jgi:hypothetical protein
MEETASYLSAAPLEIELAAGTAEYVEVEWLVGGRVRFLPRPGAATSAREFLRASVLDAAGEPQPVRFVQRNLADGVLMTNSYERQMNLQGPSECLPNLAPGRYELVLFEKDLELARIPFTIVAGQEVEVRVPLP